MEGTSIKDISPLFTLPKLYNISIINSEVEDISKLVDFYDNGNEANHKYVDLFGNKVVDFSPIEKINNFMDEYDSLELEYQYKILELSAPITHLPINVDLSFYKLHNGEKINIGYNKEGHFEEGLFVIENVDAFKNYVSIGFEREYNNIDYGTHITIKFQNNLLPLNLVKSFKVKANSNFDFSSSFQDISLSQNLFSYRVLGYLL